MCSIHAAGTPILLNDLISFLWRQFPVVVNVIRHLVGYFDRLELGVELFGGLCRLEDGQFRRLRIHLGFFLLVELLTVLLGLPQCFLLHVGVVGFNLLAILILEVLLGISKISCFRVLALFKRVLLLLTLFLGFLDHGQPTSDVLLTRRDSRLQPFEEAAEALVVRINRLTLVFVFGDQLFNVVYGVVGAELLRFGTQSLVVLHQLGQLFSEYSRSFFPVEQV